ncbi:MAG: OsmC family protein [Candidatus Caldatribacteriota bacterium]
MMLGPFYIEVFMSLMKVEYQGNYRTGAVHLDSGNTIITDAPKDNNGNGEAFSPTDLLSTSLASCMLTIAAMKARSLGVEFQGVQVEIQKKMAASPRKVSEVVLKFDWNGLDQKLEPQVLDQLKEAALNCPVALSLDPSVKKTMIW